MSQFGILREENKPGLLFLITIDNCWKRNNFLLNHSANIIVDLIRSVKQQSGDKHIYEINELLSY
jgi:hypothetical protein